MCHAAACDRQAKKTSAQLQTLKQLKSGKKAGEFPSWEKPDQDELDAIPGRTKVNKRAEALRKKQEEEARLARQPVVDWTPTDEFGNLDISVGVQVLQIKGLPDPSVDHHDGPIYVKGPHTPHCENLGPPSSPFPRSLQ